MTNNNDNPWLIFIDTNIFLDFYRKGGESAKKQLNLLERHKNSIIICDQVHMEYLKNRQKVIADSLKEFKSQDAISAPQILNDLQAAKMLAKKEKQADTQYKKLKDKMQKLITNPSYNDGVFKSLSKIFKHNGPYNLQRPDEARYEIRQLAEKRFQLGYPPRKKGDTSIGDAINWEWIVKCAKNSEQSHNVMIVSRDGDFGTFKPVPVLNDWLKLEYKERVGRNRKIIFTNKLTDALKKLNEQVSQRDKKEEEELLADNYERETFAKPDLNSGTIKYIKKLIDLGIIDLQSSSSKAITKDKK